MPLVLSAVLHSFQVIKIEAVVLKGQFQKAVVSWSGMPTGGKDHWIGVYNPGPADWTTALPLKYFKIAHPRSKGKRTINFLNQRAAVTVAYFTGSLSNPTVIAGLAASAMKELP